MNLETKITIYKFTPQVFTLTTLFPTHHNRTDGMYLQKEQIAFYMLTNIFQSRLISLIIRQFKKKPLCRTYQ